MLILVSNGKTTEDVYVIADPLLDEDSEACCGKAEYEGHEPEDIHTM